MRITSQNNEFNFIAIDDTVVIKLINISTKAVDEDDLNIPMIYMI